MPRYSPSVEFSCPIGNERIETLKQSTEKILSLQAEIAAVFLRANGNDTGPEGYESRCECSGRPIAGRCFNERAVRQTALPQCPRQWTGPEVLRLGQAACRDGDPSTPVTAIAMSKCLFCILYYCVLFLKRRARLTPLNKNRIIPSFLQAMADATLAASVNPTSVGLAEPALGKSARSVTYALLMW